MATSSLLGGEHASPKPSGTDIDALGPSDSSDSGSDVQTDRNHSALPDQSSEGALPIAHESDTAASGTGELASADTSAPEENADILPDRVGYVPGDGGSADGIADEDAAQPDQLAVPEGDRSDEDEDEDEDDDDTA